MAASERRSIRPFDVAGAAQLAGIDEDRLTTALRRFILLDVSSCATGVVTTAIAYAFVTRSAAAVVLGLAVLGAGAAIASSLRPLRRRDLSGAVARIAVANWGITLFAAAVATFTWPVQAGAALIPAVLATPYVSSKRLRTYVTVSFAVTIAIVALGLLQDWTNLSAEIPRGLQHVILIGFIPFVGGMIALLARQNNELTRAALGQVVAANSQLRASQISLETKAAALQASQARLVAACDSERRRIERNIHDGAQQHLVAIDLQLAAVHDLLGDGEHPAGEIVGDTRCLVQRAHGELRALAQGIYPPLLAARGLGAALGAAAERSPNPTTTSLSEVGRHSPDAEAAVYFSCLEALQNCTKHAGPAANLQLSVTERGRRIYFEVIDDGPGIGPLGATAGSGHVNMKDRIGAVGGELVIEQNRPRGTRVAGWVPASPASCAR